MTKTPEPCPCGLPATYFSCCGRYHQGEQAGRAPTPEALMRSRYSAFVKDLRPYPARLDPATADRAARAGA
jgi:SEC-C motif-containing protein